jgi:hypothetical protein
MESTTITTSSDYAITRLTLSASPASLEAEPASTLPDTPAPPTLATSLLPAWLLPAPPLPAPPLPASPLPSVMLYQQHLPYRLCSLCPHCQACLWPQHLQNVHLTITDITTAAEEATPRRLGSMFALPKTVPLQDVFSLLVL